MGLHKNGHKGRDKKMLMDAKKGGSSSKGEEWEIFAMKKNAFWRKNKKIKKSFIRQI